MSPWGEPNLGINRTPPYVLTGVTDAWPETGMSSLPLYSLLSNCPQGMGRSDMYFPWVTAFKGDIAYSSLPGTGAGG